jgi:hypothetical protein
MWNPFKKSSEPDKQKMGMLQRIAMKKLEKMSPEERDKMVQETFKPENKDKILAVMEQMKKSGQFTDKQLMEAKRKLGL